MRGKRRNEEAMSRFFNLENPIWRFIGNLADFFLLSLLWYLCCIPVFTLGCGSTAMYYVTLKMASNQEGYTLASFFRSFKANFKQGTVIWLIFLAVGAVLGIDLYYSLFSGSSFAFLLLPAVGILLLLYGVCLTFVFPFLARCENTTKAILKMTFVLSIRNFLPILSALILTAGMFLFGVFVFWPLLLVTPGLSAYINSFIFNRILGKYHMNLPDFDGRE